jgi:pre-mRNA-processing factor 6
LWFEFIDLEKNYGTKKELDSILKRAVEKCSEDEIFWLMYAKHVWKTESIESAKNILRDGLNYHQDSERIYLAIAKLQREMNDYTNARNTLKEAMKLNSKKIWKSLIELEREIQIFADDNFTKNNPLVLCDEAIDKYPEYSRLYLILAEMKIEKELYDEAIKIYEKGIEKNKKNANLYLAFAKLYKKLGKEGHARSIFEKSLKNIPKCEKLWYEFILFEYNNNKFSNANVLLAKAQKEFPESGLIWSLAIDIEKLNKHAVAAEALNKCERDDKVMISVARMYANDQLFDKARKWYENAIRINPTNGDILIHYYNLEKYLDENNSEDILKRCREANPTSGFIWKTISKNIENAKLKTDEIILKAIDLLVD